MIIKSSGKEDLSLRIFSGVYHCLLLVFKSYLAEVLISAFSTNKQRTVQQFVLTASRSFLSEVRSVGAKSP